MTFRTAAGETVIHYRGLFAYDALGTELPVRFASGDGENALQIMVDDAGAVYPLTVDPHFEQAYLKASNSGALDQFGGSVAIDGDTIVVGADEEDSDGSDPNDNSASFAGAAYVFTRSGSVWSEQAYLKASNAGALDQFGGSVAIDGDTIVVGADEEDSDGSDPNDNSASNAGAAYVFTRSGSVWSEQAYLKASNAEARDRFGLSVAIDGETIVIGSDLEDSDGSDPNNNSASNAGAAYVFTRSGTEWREQAYLKASNAEASDQFGRSVAIDGDTIVVGAVGEESDGSDPSDNSAKSAGTAYVFTRSGTEWSEQAYLKASNAEASDQFGWIVDIDRDTIVIGAPTEDSDGSDPSDSSASDAGAAYVFTRSGSVWREQAYLKASNAGAGDRFGKTVAIDGNTIVIGANLEDSNGGDPSDNSASGAGAAYIFTRSGSVWSEQAYLKASNAEAGDGFGWSIALSGETIAVGAPSEDSDGSGPSDNSASRAGAAYIFELDAPPTITGPTQVDFTEGETVAIDIEAADDLDSEGSGLSYAIVGGADAALFTIDPNEGLLTFNTPPDFGMPADADQNNVYLVVVEVTDSRGSSATQGLSITVVRDGPGRTFLPLIRHNQPRPEPENCTATESEPNNYRRDADQLPDCNSIVITATLGQNESDVPENSSAFFDNFIFEAGAAGRLTLSLSDIPAGSDYGLLLFDSVDSPTAIARADQPGNGDELILFNTSAGQTYHLSVTNNGKVMSDQSYTLRLTFE